MVEEGKLQSSNPDEDEEEEEEEEALSLCDLPLNEEEKASFCKTEKTQLREKNNEEDFNFGSKESEMCSADEVFFKGQILPLNRSVLSRSESMDHVFSLSSSSSLSSTASNSINSSRSSSARSYYSSTTTSNSTKNHKIRNNFHSFPSPNPQIRVSSFRLSNVGNSGSTTMRTQKSTIWDLFRVGVVRAPEIELQDLKIRNSKNASVSRNSSSGSSSNNSSSNCNQKQSKQSNGFLGGLYNLSGCKCSVEAVETVPLNKESNDEELRLKNGSQQKKKKKKQRMVKEKREVSRHRTFEWLKELSHGSYVLVDDGDRRRIS